jgi:hypothetical protein
VKPPGDPTQKPGTDEFGTVMQGYLEMFECGCHEEMINMIMAQRAYEMGGKVIHIGDEMLKQANNSRGRDDETSSMVQVVLSLRYYAFPDPDGRVRGAESSRDPVIEVERWWSLEDHLKRKPVHDGSRNEIKEIRE